MVLEIGDREKLFEFVRIFGPTFSPHNGKADGYGIPTILIVFSKKSLPALVEMQAPKVDASLVVFS